jgi:Concanavalin A-like lectin/glucanases superfamily
MKNRRDISGLFVVAVLAFATLLANAVLTTSTTSANFTDQGVNAGSSFIAAEKFWPSGQTHYWPLDGDAVDTVGSVDGVITGTTTVSGRLQSALRFDEIDDQVLVPDFAYSAEFSMTFDFKIDTNAGTLFKYAYSHGNINGTNSINVFITEASHPTPNLFRTVARDVNDTLDNLALDTDISSLIGDGNWHTYALVADSTGLTVYIDGAIAASDATRGTDGFDPAGSLHIGSRDDADVARFYGGDLDTVQIYDRALSPVEVAAHAT